MKNLKEKCMAYALKNAIAHEGKSNQGAIISGLFAEGLKKDEVKKVIKDVTESLNEVNSFSVEEQKALFEKYKNEISEREVREGLPELPDVPKNGVVMRFRPAPSGPMHIGHLISNMITSSYVKKYGGKFYVIIDDTAPDTILPEAYENIKKDCDWVFGNVTKYINSSDRISLYYEYIEKLMKKEMAYICTCSQEQFKKFSESKKDCPCRKLSIKENQTRWNKMLSKDKKENYKVGEAVLRFKSSMKNPNPAMRDFPLARINEHTHPLQKNKYRVWPLMNLVVSVDDMELKMTHIIRGKDHRDNAKRQEMIFNVFKKRYPWTFFIGRMKFTDLVLSKRKITALINQGEFSGAEDERLPTVASLRKRGYKPESFAKLAEQRGLTEVDKVISSKDFFDLLDRLNKE
jgi:glutamyl-tRNA synthetase